MKNEASKIETNTIQKILKDSNYHLGLFLNDEIVSLSEKVFTKVVRGKETPFVRCILSGYSKSYTDKNCVIFN